MGMDRLWTNKYTNKEYTQSQDLIFDYTLLSLRERTCRFR